MLSSPYQCITFYRHHRPSDNIAYCLYSARLLQQLLQKEHVDNIIEQVTRQDCRIEFCQFDGFYCITVSHASKIKQFGAGTWGHVRNQVEWAVRDGLLEQLTDDDKAT